MGKPISHSTNSGFKCFGDSGPPIPLLGAWRPSSPFVGAFSLGLAPSFQSRADGVAHPVGFCVPVPSSGENVEPLPAVWRADFSRRKESCRNPVTQRFQLAGDDIKSESEVPGDVLEEAPFRLTLPDDTSNVRPQMPLVLGSESLPRDRERLARIPAMNDVNKSTPGLPGECSEIVPERAPIKEAICHPGTEDVLAVRLLLDVADRPVAWDGQRQPEVKTSDAGTERESIH